MGLRVGQIWGAASCVRYAEPRRFGPTGRAAAVQWVGSSIGEGLAARLGRPVLGPGIPIANRANYWRDTRPNRRTASKPQSLFAYTYLAGGRRGGLSRAVPRGRGGIPGLCTPPARNPDIHTTAALLAAARRLAYLVHRQAAPARCLPAELSGGWLFAGVGLPAQRAAGGAALEPVLRHMIADVIEAGGRFYLAKDHLLTEPNIARVWALRRWTRSSKSSGGSIRRPAAAVGPVSARVPAPVPLASNLAAADLYQHRRG